jgi:hypothetical protein
VTARRRLVRVLAVVAVPVAVVLAVLAVDVLTLPDRLARGDVRFDAAPRSQSAPWSEIDFLRGWPAKRLLGAEDDLAYRQTMKRFVRVEPGRVEIFGPTLENLRGRVQLDLTTGAADDSNPKRRSRMLNLLAALSLETRSFDPDESQAVLRKAIFGFRDAVLIDPENTDAKVNLELALRNAKAVNLPGTDPTGDASSGEISGQGSSGGGY